MKVVDGRPEVVCPQPEAAEPAMAKCVRCLGAVILSTYLRNDHVCDTCANKDEEFPFGSTPGAPQMAP